MSGPVPVNQTQYSFILSSGFDRRSNDPYSLQTSKGELNHEIVEVPQSLATVGTGGIWILIIEL
jgi:hypothetical protein